jgi:hypothetical protein
MKLSALQAIGAAATIGASASAALALPQPDHSDLNTASNVTQLRGPLSVYQPPAYDGPIKWNPNFKIQQYGAVAAGALAGFLLAASVAKVLEADKSGKEGAILVAIAGATLLGGGATYMLDGGSISEVQFSTTVQNIVQADGSHYEKHGKSTQGPFYSQVVSIEESDILLAANNFRAPLIPGEKINATFYVNGDNQILAWGAAPAAR